MGVFSGRLQCDFEISEEFREKFPRTFKNFNADRDDSGFFWKY